MKSSSDIHFGKRLKQKTLLAIVGIVMFGCIGIMVAVAFLFLGFDFTKSGITVTNVIVTDNPDQQTSKTVFPVDIPTIYGIVYLDATQPVPVKVRWYYLNNRILFHEDIRRIEAKGEWFISRPLEGNFTPGKYRFEVVLVDDPVKIVDFEIK